MEETQELTEQVWNRVPNYDILPNGRIRVTRDGKTVTWFRKDFDAKAIVKHLANTGYCPFYLLALAAQSDAHVLKSVRMIPGQKLSSFAPPSQTMYLTIVHSDEGCNRPIILECDDIPRV